MAEWQSRGCLFSFPVGAPWIFPPVLRGPKFRASFVVELVVSSSLAHISVTAFNSTPGYPARPQLGLGPISRSLDPVIDSCGFETYIGSGIPFPESLIPQTMRSYRTTRSARFGAHSAAQPGASGGGTQAEVIFNGTAGGSKIIGPPS